MLSLQVNWNGEGHLFTFAIVDGDSAVPQQADTPAALELQAVPSTVAVTAEPALPLGHVSQAEKAQENSAPVEPSAPVIYSEWQKENQKKTRGTSTKLPTGITITGAVN
jgi:hypothetical protein